MASANISDFLTPPPPVMYRNQLILFLSSAFLGPPLACRRHLWRLPKEIKELKDSLLKRLKIHMPGRFDSYNAAESLV